MTQLIDSLKTRLEDILILLKWVTLAIIVSCTVGFIGALFHYAIEYATLFRLQHWYIILTLPLGGLLIIYLYHITHMANDKGTNLVLLSIREANPISFKTAPLIFMATVITHLCGGSSGREGAALQLGSSISYQIGKLFHLDEKDLHIMTMCGMSTGFSVLFGTPLAAAIFAMEVISVGIMHYAALVPCTLSALIGYGIAGKLSITPTSFRLVNIPSLSITSTVHVIILSLLTALMSIIFCQTLHTSTRLYKRFFPNPYIRIVVGSFLVLGLTLTCGSTDYLGAGMPIIKSAIEDTVVPWAFILKLIFTSLTLGAGFKGGEIVPAFFVGATFGHLVGDLFGFSSSFSASIGLIALFCGVTNCPITSFILSLELFGPEGSLFFMLACAISYMTSGYQGLYSKQKIMYSKMKPEFINQFTE
ncbi:chloride channel protein [Cellulosilyticum ruminicola]|uniref:chloride channel protein n=1 Tax=Cellulosilyticum ruminicola TaxID=425254 RepID=UPI000A7DC91D|nr:chloride channel protein [Cellulosilyticum ruminicola]